jgi:formylglycine-generating enzyme required for sulfatase activity
MISHYTRIHLKFATFLFIFLPSVILANNISVDGISLQNRNKSTDQVQVKFNLSWNNSFRTASGPQNFDAAWVFVKYKIGINGTWKHATLNGGGHTIPASQEGINMAADQPDSRGLFIIRSGSGATSTLTLQNVLLLWNYGTDGVPDESQIYVKVFAIEMVNVPAGNFQAGSGGANDGEFRQANLTTGGNAASFTITSTSPTLQGNNTASSSLNISTKAGSGNDQLTGTTTATLATGYPTGHASFYCMKYEISQGQYRDFLNTLTRTQQNNRTETDLAAGITSVTNRYVMSNTSAISNRNGIRCAATIHTSDPITFYCDLDNDGTYDESTDGEWVTCNFLKWNDVTAFLDWAALRPMTELEFEKACRGNVAPVVDEHSWGSTAFTSVTAISNGQQEGEVSNTTNANIASNNTYTPGPVRTGMFATGSSNRITAGSSYYGIMDLSGNLWEQVVSIANSTCRAFTGNVGNGALDTNGNADTGWPGESFIGRRGGSWLSDLASARVSNRSSITGGVTTRNNDYGGRGVR